MYSLLYAVVVPIFRMGTLDFIFHFFIVSFSKCHLSVGQMPVKPGDTHFSFLEIIQEMVSNWTFLQYSDDTSFQIAL